MKKLSVGLLVVVLMLTLLATSAFAAPHHAWTIEQIGCGMRAGRSCHSGSSHSPCPYGCFVDENGDGVCDNYHTPGSGHAACPYGCFVDANGDGICDNYHHPGTGQGTCPNGCFVDANGDGICDNYHHPVTGQGHHGGGHHH